MKIIVGLGNIGNEYAKTRHNCGFLALDEFVKQLEEEGIKINWKEELRLKSMIAKFTYRNQPLLLAKPTTLMNLSGEAVSKIINFYKEPLENLIIIYDDIDLPLGKIRVRKKGSAGTHNGMKSVIQELGTENFTRIRIGIESRGEITSIKQDLHSFVLSNFTKAEYPAITSGLKEAVSEIKKCFKQISA